MIARLFIFLFVYTAVSKLLDFDNFGRMLQSSPFLKPFAGIIVWALPFTELMLSVLLIIPAWRKYGMYASLISMLVFTGYIGYMMAFANHLPCTCGGVIRSMSWKSHLFFNLGWVVLALIAIKQMQGVSRKPVTE